MSGITDVVAKLSRAIRIRKSAPGRGGRLPGDNEALAYAPSLPSLDFDRGVEFGLLFARITDYGGVDACVHADMAEMVMRLAESRGLPFGAAPHEHGPGCAECIGRSDCKGGGDWLDVTIGSAVRR
jgi:hypothetical protein